MELKWPWKRSVNQQAELLANLLGNENNVEDLLDIRHKEILAPEVFEEKAAKFLNYSHTGDFQVFAEQAWQRFKFHMDAILTETSGPEGVSFHRGAANEVLYLLRLSHEAREALKARSEREQSVSSRR